MSGEDMDCVGAVTLAVLACVVRATTKKMGA